jgi:hypothetical protein
MMTESLPLWVSSSCVLLQGKDNSGVAGAMINVAPLLAQEYLQEAENARQQACSFGLFGLSGFFGCMRLTR